MANIFSYSLITVLQINHGSGWVHRDVSVGNVYPFDGRGILADLEYAKSTNDTSKHDVRTVRVSDLLSIICELRN